MKFIRGDTIRLKFARLDINGETILTKADEIWFTIKENSYTENKIIQKKLSDNSITFNDDDGFYHMTIKPEETRKMLNEKYVYDIQREVEGDIRTISLGTLELINDVTFEIGG